MNIAVGTIILAYLLAFCVFIWLDVRDECRHQTEDEWPDGT